MVKIKQRFKDKKNTGLAKEKWIKNATFTMNNFMSCCIENRIPEAMI